MSPRCRRRRSDRRGHARAGYDASPGAERALEVAIELASTFGDRLLIGYGAAPPGPPTEESRQHQRALQEMGERATAAALSRAREAGLGPR